MAKRREQAHIALLQVRDDDREIALELGSFIRASRLGAAQFRQWDAVRRAPDTTLLDGTDALIIGGSKFSVFESWPHAAALAALVRAAKERRLPTLGICFGAQLIAQVLGGEVARDAEHEERGTFLMRTSDDAMFDILFADSPETFAAQCSHRDSIVRLPSHAVHLASSDRCRNQAFSVFGNMYGLQFHAERSASDFRALIDMRAKDAGGLPFDPSSIRLEDSPEAERFVEKFIDRIVVRK